MILSDVLGADVVDAEGRRVGRLVDVRFRLEGAGDPSAPRMIGVLVSPRSAIAFLGYERTGFDRPALLAALIQWIHRGSFFVAWPSIASLHPHRVQLRAGYEREDPRLPDA